MIARKYNNFMGSKFQNLIDMKLFYCVIDLYFSLTEIYITIAGRNYVHMLFKIIPR